MSHSFELAEPVLDFEPEVHTEQTEQLADISPLFLRSVGRAAARTAVVVHPHMDTNGSSFAFTSAVQPE